MRSFFRLNLRQLLTLVTLLAIMFAVAARSLNPQTAEVRQQRLNERLFRALEKGDIKAAANALKAGADVDALGKSLYRPLRLAIERRDIAMVDLLLQAGANPNFGNGPNAQLPLATTIAANDLQITERLLHAGGKVRADSEPLDSAIGLWLERADAPMLDLLLAHGMKLRTVTWAESDSATRRLEIARMQLERGAKADGGTAPSRPIDRAVRESDGALGDLLREYGAPFTVREAVAFNRAEEVKSLLAENPALLQQRYPPCWGGIASAENPTLLGLALARGYRELSEFLLESGAPLNLREEYGETLMVQAAKGGDPNLVRLLAAKGLSVNAPGDDALGAAIWKGQLDAVKTLIELGADLEDRGTTRWKGTRLHHALSAPANRKEIIAELLRAGVDPTVTNSEGHTPLASAKLRKDAQAIEALSQVPARSSP